MFQKFPAVQHTLISGVHSPTDHIQKLRMIKSAGEIELMQTAGKIASNSFHQV